MYNGGRGKIDFGNRTVAMRSDMSFTAPMKRKSRHDFCFCLFVFGCGVEGQAPDETSRWMMMEWSGEASKRVIISPLGLLFSFFVVHVTKRAGGIQIVYTLHSTGCADVSAINAPTGLLRPLSKGQQHKILNEITRKRNGVKSCLGRKEMFAGNAI